MKKRGSANLPIYHKHFEQRSAAWFRIRAGIPTASEMDRIITPTGKPSKQCTAYMHRLLSEWVLGEPIMDEYESRYMLHGREYEEQAVQAFEFQTEQETTKVGFVTADDGLLGCSPDRLVGDHGTLEIKCPAPNTQIGYLLDTSVADEYLVQVQAQMWITERDVSWVSSYHPKLPSVILEIRRDEEFIAKLATATRTFVDIMLQRREELEKRYGPFERPKIAAAPDRDEDMKISEADLDVILAEAGWD